MKRLEVLHLMLGIKIYTYFKGELVGEDDFGNKYYRNKNSSESITEKRWVIYSGEEEASKVPAEWHGWLHRTFDVPPSATQMKRHSWQKTHLPNLTGTPLAYAPPGLSIDSSKGNNVKGDYEPWTPA